MSRRPKAVYEVSLFCKHFCEKHETIRATGRADATRQGQDRLSVWMEENDRDETDKCGPGSGWVTGPYEDSQLRIPGEGYDEWQFESADDADPPRP